MFKVEYFVRRWIYRMHLVNNALTKVDLDTRKFFFGVSDYCIVRICGQSSPRLLGISSRYMNSPYFWSKYIWKAPFLFGLYMNDPLFMSQALATHGHFNVPFFKYFFNKFFNQFWGAQWLSGRVLDSRPRGRGFEPHRRHLSKTHLF